MTMRIWDVNSGYCVQTIPDHTGWIRNISPSLDGRYLLSTGEDKTCRLWNISTTTPECKLTFTGHDHFNECCALAPPSAYKFLALLAGLKRPPPANSTAEFMATGSRDKEIRLWDSRGICIKTLVGHDKWIRSLVVHPGGKFLVSVSDDKSLRCWDLSQGGKCVRVLEDIHDHFVTCLRWAPGIVRKSHNDTSDDGAQHSNVIDAKTGPDIQIRCVVATGSVDLKLRIFSP